jgi:hypothetical protein
MIQDLEFFAAGALDLKQAKPVTKQPLIFNNKGDAVSFKDRDAGEGKTKSSIMRCVR